MNALLYLSSGILFIAALTQCQSTHKKLTEYDLARLKQKYSPKAINYFYETAFFSDYVGPKDILSKWENDVWICWQGDLWPRDSLYVKQAVKQLNDLNLPIDLRITQDTAMANLPVYFGNFDYLEKKLDIQAYRPFIGVGIIPDYLSKIVSAKIGISNNASRYAKFTTSEDSAKTRRSVILEEITQSLGIPGDSWMYHNSTFYEGDNQTIYLSKLDREVLKLLYEPSIPSTYPREQFEEDFSDVLYHENAGEKLIRYVKANHVPLRYLDSIRSISFNDSSLWKYPPLTFVKLAGDVQPQDSVFCRAAISKINTISDRLHLELAPNDMWHASPSITIQFVNDTTGRKSTLAERTLQPGGMMFTWRVLGAVKLTYSSSDPSQTQVDRYNLLLGAMSKILGLDHARGNIGEVDSRGQIYFDPDYKEILALLYHPVFPPGFTQQEMDEVISTLREEQTSSASR